MQQPQQPQTDKSKVQGPDRVNWDPKKTKMPNESNESNKMPNSGNKPQSDQHKSQFDQQRRPNESQSQNEKYVEDEAPPQEFD